MKFIKILLILTTFYISYSLFAQVQEEWVQRFNGSANGNDAAYSIKVDHSGSIYVTGLSYNGTNNDYLTIKYNSSGVQQWVQIYNGPANDNDQATSMIVDNSSNIYVTGSSWGGAVKNDILTIKYNSSGVQQWVQRYDGPGNWYDEATSIAVDNSGNIYVTGLSEGSGTYTDYVTIKYNSSGVQQWIQRYNGPDNGDDYASSIALDNSGNIFVTGASDRIGNYKDYVTIKYNSSGIQQWVQSYNGPGNFSGDYASSIALDNSGNIFVTGFSEGSGTNYDYATIKYNSNGVEQWVQRYNGPGNNIDVANSIAIDNTGNVYVTGRSAGNGSNDDYATIKYNSSGVQQWIQRFNGPGNIVDVASSITIDNTGNVYVTGRSTGSGSNSDYATIKYNSAGVEQWIQRYNGPGNNIDESFSITTDTSGFVYVTGRSTGSGSGYDVATIKYSQPIGITPISNEIPDVFKLEQNYPNPFNPKTIINFQLPSSSFVKLIVYDMLGREIETLANQNLNSGIYDVDWDAYKYSSGVYYYRLIAGDYSEVKKMILIK